MACVILAFVLGWVSGAQNTNSWQRCGATGHDMESWMADIGRRLDSARVFKRANLQASETFTSLPPWERSPLVLRCLPTVAGWQWKVTVPAGLSQRHFEERAEQLALLFNVRKVTVTRCGRHLLLELETKSRWSALQAIQDNTGPSNK